MKKKLKKFENYALSWKFLKESRWYVVFSVFVFALFFLIGFVFPVFFRQEIIELLKGLAELFVGKGLLETIILIFLNNLQASFLAIVLGIVFGIFPLIILIVNGYILGFVSREAANVKGLSVLWRLIPHGIFELPAVMFSVGLGIKIGTSVLSKKRETKTEFREALRFFLFIVIPLLLIAAIIEGILISLVG